MYMKNKLLILYICLLKYSCQKTSVSLDPTIIVGIIPMTGLNLFIAMQATIIIIRTVEQNSSAYIAKRNSDIVVNVKLLTKPKKII